VGEHCHFFFQTGANELFPSYPARCIPPQQTLEKTTHQALSKILRIEQQSTYYPAERDYRPDKTRQWKQLHLHTMLPCSVVNATNQSANWSRFLKNTQIQPCNWWVMH